jgi:ribosomal protein S18 acetylase RimI-like enzyme
MKWIKSCIRTIFPEYAFYRVYSVETSATQELEECLWLMGPINDVREICSSPDPALRSLAQYAGDEAFGFGAWDNGKLAAVCWFWAGKRYQTRNFWPLLTHEAKLVQITTSTACRGRGIASSLIKFAGTEMKKAGFERLFARVWHSNRPSIAAFERAGWRYTAFVLEIRPFVFKKSWRFIKRVRQGQVVAL